MSGSRIPSRFSAVTRYAMVATLAAGTTWWVTHPHASSPQDTTAAPSSSPTSRPVAAAAAVTDAPAPPTGEATAMAAAAAEREVEVAGLKADNARLNQLVRDLQSEVSILNARRAPAPSASLQPSQLPQVPQRILSELLGNPETVAMAMDWIKADQAQRYASLIALAGLDPEREEQLRSLLAERYATRLDVAAAGLESVTPEQRQQFDTDYRARLEGLVGTDIADLFDKAEGKPVSFATLQRLEDRLRYGASPLNREQYLPLWNLVSSQVTYSSGIRSEADIEARLQQHMASRQYIVEQARTILAPAQVEVLSHMFADELAVARIQAHSAIEAMRQRQATPSSRPPAP